MRPSAIFALVFAVGCKMGNAPIETTEPSPRPTQQSQTSPYSQNYSQQPRIDNNQAPLGNQRPPITNESPYVAPEGAKPFTFEELNQNTQQPATITVQNIRSQQVFQRNAQNQGQVPFALSPPNRPARYMRARAVFDGNRQPLTQFQTLDLQQGSSAPLSLTVGGGAWYRIEVLFYDQNGRIQELGYSNPFGIGDVFVIAGQSNSTNCGSTPTTVATNYVVSTDGERWQTANDPQIGTNDSAICQGGSSWPSAGDDLVSSLQVPIAFASTGYSGTTIAEWLPNSGRGLYEFMIQRARQLGPRSFRAILWHQGESDVKDETTQQVYSDRMMQIIRQSHQDLGWQVPWIVAQAAWCRQIPEYNKPQAEAPILAAQAALPRSFPYIFAGPNTDQFTELYRSTNCHFNREGAIASGKAWARSIADFVQRSSQSLR